MLKQIIFYLICERYTIDVLGCINDYCENKRFHTIVVVNENKIYGKETEITAEDITKENGDGANQPARIVLNNQRGRSIADGISYEEIKEKIIERTIKYKPDYKGIVHAVIADQARLSEEYHEFLEIMRIMYYVFLHYHL